MIAAVLAALIAPEQIQGLLTSFSAKWLTGAGNDCNKKDAVLRTWTGDSDSDTARDIPTAEIITISQHPSSAYPGRATLRVEIAARPVEQGWLLVTQGRYGQPNTLDFDRLGAEASRPDVAECTEWYRYFSRTDQQGWALAAHFDGLWGERTYCFTVHTGADYGEIVAGNTVSSEPRCHTIHWNPSWGWMEWPPIS